MPSIYFKTKREITQLRNQAKCDRDEECGPQYSLFLE